MFENNEVQVIEADLGMPAHRDAVERLLDAYARDDMGIGRPLDDMVHRRLVAGLQAHPCCLIFLAQRESQAVGLAVCFLGYSTFAARPLVNIHDLVVDSRFRRQGVGARLLAAVEARARALDCCKVTLEVRSDNAVAQSLYTAQGFAPGCPHHEFWTKSLGPTPAVNPE